MLGKSALPACIVKRVFMYVYLEEEEERRGRMMERERGREREEACEKENGN
jgi:hypothetical protein